MLLVAVSSARLARRNLDVISPSSSFLADCGGFCCSVRLEPSMMKSSSSSTAPCFFVSAAVATLCHVIIHSHQSRLKQKQPQQHQHNNNNNTIWGGSVLTGEEPPPYSGELKHALPEAGGPTQSQLSNPMSSGHHISMEHRQRRKHLLLNANTNA